MATINSNWTLVAGTVEIDAGKPYVSIKFTAKSYSSKELHLTLFYGENLKRFNPAGWYMSAGKLVCVSPNSTDDNVVLRDQDKVMCFVNFDWFFYVPHEDDSRMGTKGPYRFLAVPAVVTKIPYFKAHVSLQPTNEDDAKRNSRKFMQADRHYKEWFGDDNLTTLSSSFSNMSMGSRRSTRETLTKKVMNPNRGFTLLRTKPHTDHNWVTGKNASVLNGEKVTVAKNHYQWSEVDHKGTEGWIRSEYLRGNVDSFGYTFA